MRRLSFLLVFLFSLQLMASVAQLSAKGGTWSFSTENVGTSSQSNSGMGAYAFEFGYSFKTHWMLSVGVNLVLSDLIKGSSGYGFDLGGKYFPFTASGTTHIATENSELVFREIWRPYVGAFMRQRIFGLAVSTSYLGPGLSVGVDYSLNPEWLVSFEVRYDYLYGEGDALAIQNNILLGLGYEF